MSTMNDENWKKEFLNWKTDLKPLEIKLLEEGAQSQNQACILIDMWCEWKRIAAQRKIKEIVADSLIIKDPWEEGSDDPKHPGKAT